MLKKVIKLFLVLSLLVSIVFNFPKFTSANSLTNREKLEVIQQIEFESTIDELVDLVENTASSEGLNYSNALDLLYKEAVLELKDWNSSEYKIPKGSSELVLHSYMIPPAAEIGDIYYTRARTLGYNHGHVAMYHYMDNIIQAPGPGKLSNIKNRSESRIVKNGSQIGRVLTSLTNRRAAANYAKTYLVDKPYDKHFISNKKVTTKLNCSGLVWFAYKKAANLDLDEDGGKGVYPHDIMFHDKVDQYKWL